MSPKTSLSSRIVILTTILMLIVFTVLGVTSALIVRDSVQRTLQERLVLAQATADHLDYVLKINLDLLQGVAFTSGLLNGGGNPEQVQRALRETYFHTIFSEGVYIVDRNGQVLRREPASPSMPVDISGYEHVERALSTGRLVVSNTYLVEATGKPVVSVVIPVRDGTGAIVGLVGADVNPTDGRFQRIIEPVGLGPSGYVEVVDGRGTVIAGSVSGHVLNEADHANRLSTLIRDGQTTVGTCHDCHTASTSARPEPEVMAFAPLHGAPWGVLIREPERDALAPANNLQWQLILIGLPSFAITIALAWAFAQSITKPLRELTSAADEVASGNLSTHVRDFGSDEVGQLARSFDQMRRRLGDSLQEVRTFNRELEKRVAERTQALESSYREIREKDRIRGELLRKVISAQEEERLRIARELHDETSQALAALMVAIDAAITLPPDGQGAATNLATVRKLAAGILDGVHKLTFDLRPSLLDDLGLLAAIRWYAESRLQPLGVKVHVEVEGEETPAASRDRPVPSCARSGNQRCQARGSRECRRMHRLRRLHRRHPDRGRWQGIRPRRGRDGLGQRLRLRTVGDEGKDLAHRRNHSHRLLCRRGNEDQDRGSVPVRRNGMQRIRVLVVDDHAILRDGVRAFLSLYEDIEVVGEASDGKDALGKVARHRPDVVLMDIAMPGLGGLEATMEVRKLNPDSRVLVLSQHDNKEYVHSVLKAGACGYVLKKSAGSELIAAIRAVHRGESYLDPFVARTVIDGYLGRNGEDERNSEYDKLSDRETQVLKLVAEGLSNKEIADLLCVSVKTVMGHRANVMEKLGIHSRTELVKYAIKRGLIDLQD